MVAVPGGDRAASNRGEVPSYIEVIYPEDREPALKGISPARASGGEGIEKIAGQLTVHHIRSGRIEVTSKQGGRVRKARGLLENVASEGKFIITQCPVSPVSLPSGAIPQTKVRGRGAEVHVDHLDGGARGDLNRHLMITLSRIADFALDSPARDDAVRVVDAVIAMATVDHIGDHSDLRGGDVLEQDNVRLPRGDV